MTNEKTPKKPEYPDAAQVRASYGRATEFIVATIDNEKDQQTVMDAFLGWVGGTIAKLEMATWTYGPENIPAEIVKVRQHQERTKAADAAADPAAKGAKAAAVRVEIKRMARTSTAAKLQLNYWLQRLKLPDATFEALDALPLERLEELAAHLERRVKVPWWPMWDPTASEGAGAYRCPGIGCGAQMYDNGPDARSKRDPSKGAPWLSCSNKACTLGDGKFGLAIWSSAEMPGALKRQEKETAVGAPDA